MPPLHLLVLARAEERDDLIASLREAGHRAEAAADGAAAADALTDAAFDACCSISGGRSCALAQLREALAPARDAEPGSLDEAERRHIALTLRYTGGNRRRAAQLLGISRSTLLHKVRKYGLETE